MAMLLTVVRVMCSEKFAASLALFDYVSRLSFDLQFNFDTADKQVTVVLTYN